MGAPNILKETARERKELGFYKEAMAELTPDDRQGTKYRIREWKPVHTKILVLVQKGMTGPQIAAEAEIGYTLKQINHIIKDPLFRMKLNQYNKKMDVAIIEKAMEEISRFPVVALAKDKLAASAEKAANLLLNLMNPKSRMFKNYSIHDRRFLLTIAQDVLDRSGLKQVITVEEGGKSREYSPEEIRSALDNAKELEEIAGRLDKRGSSYVLSKEQRRESDGQMEASGEAGETQEHLQVETAFFDSDVPTPEKEAI